MASIAGARLFSQAPRKACLFVCVLLVASVVSPSYAKLDREAKQFLLDTHNDFRSSVGASNMRLMVGVRMSGPESCILRLFNTVLPNKLEHTYIHFVVRTSSDVYIDCP